MKLSNPIGAHYSIANGYARAFEAAAQDGATALQIFIKSPRGGQLREVTESEAAEVKKLNIRKQTEYGVIHASYLLNFAKKMPADSYPMKSLTEDLRSADKLELDGVVLHLGKTLGGDVAEAEEMYIKNIERALVLTKNCRSKIILENTAGQGSEMGWRFDEFARVFRHFKKYARVKICLDTQHAFAAGYEPGSLIKEFDKYLGLKNIACLHFNDSKKLLGSRVDRHQDIGKGVIGELKLKNLIKDLNKITRTSLPLILETPEEHLPYASQIKQIRSWF